MKTRASGFSLVELMIVVVIVAILAGIAYPSYVNQILRSHRAEAKSVLLQVQLGQEKYFLQNNAYVTTAALLVAAPTAGPPGLGILATSPGGHYNITVATNGPAPSFIVTATAAGAQLNDTECKTFTITQTGAKAATDSGGSASTVCW
jgi:type IV pilus assembly protein PilE